MSPCASTSTVACSPTMRCAATASPIIAVALSTSRSSSRASDRSDSATSTPGSPSTAQIAPPRPIAAATAPEPGATRRRIAAVAASARLVLPGSKSVIVSAVPASACRTSGANANPLSIGRRSRWSHPARPDRRARKAGIPRHCPPPRDHGPASRRPPGAWRSQRPRVPFARRAPSSRRRQPGRRPSVRRPDDRPIRSTPSVNPGRTEARRRLAR